MKSGILPLIAIALLGGAGEVILYVGPFFVGAISEAFKIQPAAAGILFGSEILISAGVAIVASSNLHRLPGRGSMVFAIGLVLFGDSLTCFMTGLPGVVACRLIAATGAGAIFAGGNAIAAGTRTPDRTYTFIGVAAIALSIVAFLLIPVAQSIYGPKALFALFVALGLPALAFSAFLPPFPRQANGATKSSVSLKQSPVLAALAIVLFMYLGSNGLWAYIERIGVDADHLPVRTVASALVWAAVVAAFAPILATVIYRRVGLQQAITLGLVAQAVGSLVIVYVHGESVFLSLAVLLTMFLIFVLTLTKIGMAKIDPSGKVVGTATGLITLGSGAGPVLGGALLTIGGGYPTLGWMASLCMFVCVFAAFRAFGDMRTAKRSRDAQATEALVSEELD